MMIKDNKDIVIDVRIETNDVQIHFINEETFNVLKELKNSTFTKSGSSEWVDVCGVTFFKDNRS